jgi:hypothetical protein
MQNEFLDDCISGNSICFGISDVEAFPGLCAALLKAGVAFLALPQCASDHRTMPHLAIPEQLANRAAIAMVASGAIVCPSSRLCPPFPLPADEVIPLPRTLPAAPKHYVGLWSLRSREQPIGTIVDNHPENDCPLWLQTRCGVYVDVRLPAPSNGISEVETFAGYCQVEENGDGNSIAVWHRILDFQPPTGKPDCGRNVFEDGGQRLLEYGHPRNHYKEIWQRLDPGTKIVALELLPKDGLNCQAGYWVFSGDWFVRAVGLKRGTGLVASQCAPSLSAVREYHGTEKIDKELADCWESVYGRMTRHGLLERWGEGKSSGVFLDATFGGISVQKENGLVVVKAEAWETSDVKHPVRSEERWRILEMDFDPFSPIP